MTPVIYLASPIDQGNASDDKKTAHEWLRGSNCAVFDPSSAWSVSKSSKPNPALQRGNMALLRQCHGVLAIVKPDVLTIGVVLEIQEAVEVGIPVQVCGRGLQPSWSLAYLGLEVHYSVQEAIKALLTEVYR